jgi:hypothetical protein
MKLSEKLDKLHFITLLYCQGYCFLAKCPSCALAGRRTPQAARNIINLLRQIIP